MNRGKSLRPMSRQKSRRYEVSEELEAKTVDNRGWFGRMMDGIAGVDYQGDVTRKKTVKIARESQALAKQNTLNNSRKKSTKR